MRTPGDSSRGTTGTPDSSDGWAASRNAWSRPPIAYAESASFVKFLVDTHGRDRLLQAFAALHNSDDETVRKENIDRLVHIYDHSLESLEKQWYDALAQASP